MDIDQGAIEKLQNLLAGQAELTRVQIEANKLKDEEIKVKQHELETRNRELDLEAQRLAIERETENRRNANINEVIQRLVRESERSERLTSKLVTVDDSFGETVQRVIISIRLLTSAQIDLEKAIYALLTQNSPDIRDARLASPQRLEKLRDQDLLLQHQETLHALKLQAAAHGSLEVPIKLLRQIENEEREITDLEEKLN